MKKRLLLLVANFLFCFALFAQNRTVTGIVASKEDGLPLPGVSVKVKGSNVGVSTGPNGRFSLTVPTGTISLEFSSIGYSTQTVAIGEQQTVNVLLESSSKALTEVVVTGYGTIAKKDFTGSASRVTGDAIKDKPVQSFGQGLTGQAAGVNIVQPNGLLNNPPVIRVRGVSSISLNSFPLVIVDGIPFPTGDVSTNSSANNPLGDINPADIESIDILKDAASTAIYGSRAAAGVLVITTKKGKAGSSKITYDNWIGSVKATRLPELLNAQQYMDVKNTAVTNALQVNPASIGPLQHVGGKSFFPNYNPDGSMVDTRWYDEVYRTAYSQNHNLNLSGGSEKTSYFLSGGLSNQKGFLKANGFKRYTGRANLTHKATDWLNLNLNMAFTNSDNNSPNSGSVPGGAFNSSGLGRIAFALSPNLAVRNANGTYNYTLNSVGSGNNLIGTSWSHPSVLIEHDRNISETTRFLTNLGAEVKIIDGLSLKSTYSWDKSYTENIRYWNPFQGDGYSAGGNAFNSLIRRNSWNWITTLQYNKTFGDHHFNAQVGSDFQNTRTLSWGALRTGLLDPNFFDNYQGTFANIVAAGNGISQIAFESYIANASYNYKGRYYLSGNFRRDGNSGLAFKNRWGNFGGASVAWEIAQEDFFKNSTLGSKVSSLRLRASYGTVGNGNVGPYNEFTTFGSGLYGASALAWAFNQAGNNVLSWEVTKQTDIGLSASLFSSRLTLEVDYFNKHVDNLILGVPQAASKGIPGNSILLNVGSMYNRGFEFALSGSPIKTNRFSWNANLNFTSIKNKVQRLASGIPNIIGSTGGLESASITEAGKSVSGIYAVRTNGVNPANGRRIFLDANGREVQYLHHAGTTAWTYVDNGAIAPAITAAKDAVYAGNTMPTWYGGFNNTLTYGNFDLAFNFTFTGGNYIYNGSRAGLLDQRFWNNSTEVLDAWTTPGQVTKIPKVIYGDNISNGSSFPITDNVEKGDFLRLQTATLGYKLPTAVFGRTGIKSLRVYGQVTNAFIITGYTGVDPEISTNGNSNLAAGIERNSIPQGRSFTFGLSLGL